MSGRLSSSVFVGREQELARLREFAPETDDATSQFALIGGDAGIGKTRLVTELTAEFDDRQVLTGGCLQLGGAAAPLAPVTEILRTLTHDRGEDAVQRLLDGPRAALTGLLVHTAAENQRGPLGGPDASQLHEAVLSLLEALAEDGTTVVVIEDLHWAAPTMLDLVTFLVRNPPRAPLLLVLTFRSDELHRRHPLRPVLADLSRLGTVERIDLAPLTPAQQQRQAEDILGRAPTDAEAANLVRSEGNAFFVEELVNSPATDGHLPTTLRDILSDRLAALPEEADEVTRVAAAAGRTVDHRLLETVADLEAGALRSGLRGAVEHGVLVPDDHRYRFRHALLQEAAYDELLPGERLRLHRALADALKEHRELAADGSPSADAEIAHHADQAMLPDLAYTASLAAAERAAGIFAFDEALIHLERALTFRDSCTSETLDAGPPRRELLLRAGVAADEAGDPVRSIAHLETAVAEECAGATPEEVADLHNAIALTHKSTMDERKAVPAVEQALAIAPEHSTQRATALAFQSLVNSVALSQPTEAVAPGQAALDLARELGEPRQEAIALFALGTARSNLGQIDEAIPLHHASIKLATDLGLMMEATINHINLGGALGAAGRVDDAQVLEARWLSHCDAIGYATPLVDFLRCNHAHGLLLSGDVSDATTELAKVRNRPEPMATVATYLVAALALHLVRANFVDAAAMLAEHRDLIKQTSQSQYVLPFAEAQGLLALADRRHDDAWRLLDHAREITAEREVYEPIRPAAARVEADRLTVGPVDDATHQRSLERIDLLLRDLEEMLAEAVDSPTWSAHLQTALAQVAAERTRAEGEPDPDAWLAAEEGVAEQGRVPEVAYLKIRRAEAFAGLDHREEATALLREVHADCVDRGMVWCAQQAEAVAKRARIRLPGLDTPSGDPFGLTDRERDVLTLLAEGLTNPQVGERLFISDKTASVHVSHILTKLNATNRNQAAAIARDHGLDGEP